jgi:WD40 repeat protein
VDYRPLLSPDGSTILFGDALIRAADGQKVSDLGAEDLEQYDLMEHAFVDNRKVVSALHFGWEAGDDLFMRLRDAAHPGKDDTRQGNVGSIKPSDFMGFLQDGRYIMTGRDGSFRLTDWSSGKTVAVFRLGSSSRIPPEMAIALLKRVTRVDPVPARGLVRLTLRDGPTLQASGAEDITGALMLDGGRQSIAARSRLEASLDATEALSADGRWLATAAKGRLRVWDASNGQPLTEWISFVGDAKDLQFSADDSVLLLATSQGALIRLPVIFRWESKPPWLGGLAEALTGLTLAQDGRVMPVSPQRFAELRAQVATQLASDPADTPALRLLRSRLSVAHQPPGLKNRP